MILDWNTKREKELEIQENKLNILKVMKNNKHGKHIFNDKRRGYKKKELR